MSSNLRLTKYGNCLAAIVAATVLLASTAHAREWTDTSGQCAFEAELFGFNDEIVVLKRPDGELGSLQIEQLSDADREYLQSKEAIETKRQNIEKTQTWTTRDGLELVGRVVDYARDEVTVQRRRGHIYVNDRRLANLPTIYQELVPRIVEHFDEVEIPDARAMQNWVLSLRGVPRTFRVDGVIFELQNGDEYAIPFFVFSERSPDAGIRFLGVGVSPRR